MWSGSGPCSRSFVYNPVGWSFLGNLSPVVQVGGTLVLPKYDSLSQGCKDTHLYSLWVQGPCCLGFWAILSLWLTASHMLWLLKMLPQEACPWSEFLEQNDSGPKLFFFRRFSWAASGPKT